MKNILLSITVGLTATFIAFSLVKNWEEDKRLYEFQNRAQAHTAAVQAEFENIAKQMEDIRFLVEYDINQEHESPTQPQSFMNMVAPLLTHEPALIDVAWALQANKHNQVHVIYSWKHHTFNEKTHYTITKDPLQGSVHQDNQSKRYEVRLVAPVTNQVQDIQSTHQGQLQGQEIAAIITEWDVATIIEEALKHTPVSAQDITFFSTCKDKAEEQIYFHPSRSRTPEDKGVHTDISYTTTFDFAGLHWKAYYEAAPKFLDDFPIVLAWQIMLLGIVLTLILTWYLYNKAQYTTRVEALVRKKTKKLRKSEKHFRSIINNLQDIYFRQDADGIIKNISPSVSALGYTVDEVVGTHILEHYINPDDHENFLQALQDSPNGKIANYQMPGKHKDGSIRWLSINAQFTYDNQNNINGVEGTIRDYTEIKEAEERMQHMDRLESLGMLAGGIAHDFNNLLTAILGNASIVRMETKDDSPIVPRLDSIEKASLSAADLCKQMLAYAGKGKYFVEPLDLGNAISGVSEIIRTSLDKNIKIESDFAIHTPAIDGDGAQIKQIAMNLITNAAESYEDKPGVISIKVGVCDMDALSLSTCAEGEHLEPGSYVYMKVSDQGCGMDEDTKKKILEPFFTTKFTGRGLGLSATRGILRSHHGAMHIHSVKGEGTSITVYFPASKHSIKESEPQMTTQCLQHAGTVLLVDDEKHVQDTVSMMLEELGYEVMLANNGQEGIDIFQEHQDKISFVLLDMTMPVMNGKDCFIGIKAIKPDACVILSSGYTEEETTQDFPEGLAGFLQKPYTLKALDLKLTQVLQQSA